ncbi:MAG: type IV secretion system protein [Alphaproteobacteria bacterium]|nr:type IV secretion system protein [Alphaproteobacteria bacterium]
MKTFDKNKKNLCKTGLFLLVFICFLGSVVCNVGSAEAASTIEELQDDSFWSTSGPSTISEFYTETYELLMYVAGSFAYKANIRLSTFCLTLLGIAFVIWLFAETGKMFASVTGGAAIGPFASAVMFRGFIVLVAATLIDFNGNTSNMPIVKELGNPVLISSYKLSSAYLNVNPYIHTNFDYRACMTTVSSNYDGAPDSQDAPSSLLSYRKQYLNKMSYDDPNAFTGEMVMYGGCVLRQIANSIASIGLLGTALIIDSFSMLIINMDFLGFLAGIFIVISSFILLLIVPINLLSSVYKITIIASIFPILLVLWAFPVTKTYFNRGVLMYIQACLHVILICIMLGFCITTMCKFAFDTGIFGAVEGNEPMSEVRQEFGNMATAGFTALLVMPWLTILLVERAEIFADYLIELRLRKMIPAADIVKHAARSIQVTGSKSVPKVGSIITKGASNLARRS